MAIPKSIQFLYLSSIYFSLLVLHSGSISFNYNFSDSSTYEHIRTEDDAYLSNGKITLNLVQSVGRGRATYNQPIPLWDENTSEVANFTTQFSFLIQNITPTNFGDGLAFFLSKYPSQIIQDGGASLALFNISTAVNASANPVVAVEFDTHWNNGIDPNSTDPTDCHIGIDVNKINSTSYQIIPNNKLVGVNMTAKVEYNSWLKLLSATVWHENDPAIQFNVNTTVDIRKELPYVAAVGFSATTGLSYERHEIFSWSFNSTLELKQNSSMWVRKNKISAPVIGGIVASIFLMFSLVVILMIYYLKKRSIIEKIGEIEMIGNESIDSEFEKGRGPKRFPYSELVDATNGFGENNKLGEGGFGSVYRGILKNENIYIAVKRVSNDSSQGKKEYMSEVKIISRLRHRNLVQLIGWCHDNGELLLVYELLDNESLDKHLHSNETLLTWPIRHNIALGLCSALFYLHEECEKCVVHRDIKPSNIMLDSLFNAKLGDFGLARLIDRNQDVETVLAGTRAYMAPECIFGTANASTQSDVYSFGLVLLELSCGRGPIIIQQNQRKVRLNEWVWEFYGRNALVEAVDTRLTGAFNEEEVKRMMVVGLWCAHPDYSSRPSIRQAMSALHFQSGLPVLPQKMPVPVYIITSIDPNMQPCSSSEALSNGIIHNSTKSAPIVSSEHSWLLKQEAKTC